MRALSILILMVSLFSSCNKEKRVIMIGDSLTELGCWDELLPSYDVVNLGVGGYRIEHLIDPDYLSEVHGQNGDYVVVMVGVNDAMNGIPIETAIGRYAKLLDALQSNGERVVLQTTIHQSHTKNQSYIESLNEFIRDYAFTNEITLFDIDEVLCKDGVLRKDLSLDGTHLNPEGYRIWAAYLTNTLANEELEL